MVAGMGGLGDMLAGAGHKQEFRANTTHSQHLSSVSRPMLQRHLKLSVCPVSRNNTPYVGELCGTPGLDLCLPT